ncbi:alpha-ketoglutarate-dependent dioxygenase AlkB family protein [Flagellimonas myxillae]|uniref:alpha-ketoglutarate-dependent dioxygenase AlkB family protein n=1 Tax=Flagellimonas myxillae TaxID=2942214 RepID=UPI00201F9F77|nr:alpha-ketoglutarate-dependent dioxygenase AlkB [Muricauda myxillae]MCL6267949.1 alpha-ketoglutarate-dependent dioxygenase AlkB [Muricauda myxillae]
MGFTDNGINLNLPKSDMVYYPAILSTEKSDQYFKILKETVPWRQDEITVFGKTHPQPRLTALYGNNSKAYSYSGITMQPLEFTQNLLDLKEIVEQIAKTSFSTCLLNFYRDGKDSNGWHSDDEKELGKNPVIASVSLGAERFFHLRNKSDKTLKHKMLLEHGSLLVMKGETQHFWQHQIPKTAKPIGERINLTFRVIQ